MQFKPDMIVLIQSGAKTQTRRPVKAGDVMGHGAWSMAADGPTFVANRGRIRWEEGKRYSVCPGRGMNRVGLIRLLEIRREMLATITEQDAMAEGVSSREEFLRIWKAIYAKSQLDDEVWVLRFDTQ